MCFYCRNGRFTKGSAKQAYESGDERGLIYGYVLNGRGGGPRVGPNQI
ncbi:hypothetical protein ACPTGO_31410, partial [Pseudomonas aeruginosa]